MHPAADRTFARVAALAAVIAIALSAVPAARAAQVYGTAPDLAVATPVSAILAQPADFVGKVVKAQGMIVDVCASRGCWLELGGDKAFETIRIKVQDGVIVFPLSARGRKAWAQGKLEAIAMDAAAARRFREHQALEKGEAFDPKIVTGPLTIYQIKPTGVLVE